MEEAEGAVLAAAKAAKPQRDEQAYQDYRAGERNAEAIAAEYQTRKAVQEYRQGERAEIATPVVTPEPKKPWWQRVKEWISSPSTWWGLSTEDEAVKLMQKTRGFPDIPIILPMLKGFGMDDVAGPLKYTLKTDTTIRLIGRVMDDFSPGVLTGIGWGVTIAPNLVKNIRNKNPWHQTTADLIVDTVGFAVSEAAGWGVGALAGALTGNPVAILVAKVAGDGLASIGWDYLAERYRWSDWLSQNLEAGAQSFEQKVLNAWQQSLDVEKYPPVPTPSTPLATGTPAPAGQNPDVQPSGTPVPGHTSTSTAPIPTRPPTP